MIYYMVFVLQEMLGSSWVSVEMEVRPRWLVPDTNCFIDHLALLQAAARPAAYTLAVPLVGLLSHYPLYYYSDCCALCIVFFLDWFTKQMTIKHLYKNYNIKKFIHGIAFFLDSDNMHI